MVLFWGHERGEWRGDAWVLCVCVISWHVDERTDARLRLKHKPNHTHTKDKLNTPEGLLSGSTTSKRKQAAAPHLLSTSTFHYTITILTQ